MEQVPSRPKSMKELRLEQNPPGETMLAISVQSSSMPKGTRKSTL
jgi:hypothetical protein